MLCRFGEAGSSLCGPAPQMGPHPLHLSGQPVTLRTVLLEWNSIGGVGGAQRTGHKRPQMQAAGVPVSTSTASCRTCPSPHKETPYPSSRLPVPSSPSPWQPSPRPALRAPPLRHAPAALGSSLCGCKQVARESAVPGGFLLHLAEMPKPPFVLERMQ